MGCDLFSRVGACGRRPSESADPGVSASWVLLKKKGIGLSRERSFTGAGGWGLLVDQRRQFWLRKRVVLRRENEGSGLGDDSGSGRVSDRVPGRLPEVLRRAFGTSGVVEKWSKFAYLAFSHGESRIRLTLNRPGRRAFRETTREGAAILEGTVQDWAFPHQNIEKVVVSS